MIAIQDAHAIDKRQVRRSFERAAQTYDRAAVLQRRVCDLMLARLDSIKPDPAVILDAGCGTGYGSRRLWLRYPNAHVIALDIARAMLEKARSKFLSEQTRLRFRGDTAYVGADAEQLPLKGNCVGLAWSSLALQWCTLSRVFAEIHRVLAPGGLFMFSTFGPGTLKELRGAFADADGYTHVNRFPGTDEVAVSLVRHGFTAPQLTTEFFTLSYEDVAGVMRDLKAIGAHNLNRGRCRGLAGKSAWRRAASNYETLRGNGKLPATFEVVHGYAWKASAA